MKNPFANAFAVLGMLTAGLVQPGRAQNQELGIPKVVEAGSAFSIPTTGSGQAELYVVGPAGVFRRSADLGQAISFRDGEITNAGHYLAVLAADSFTQTAEFDVVARKPAALSFLAKPSRLPVNQAGGISGVAYVFDPFQNLVLDPLPVTFRLSGNGGETQVQTVATKNGVAWVRMNSSQKAGPAQFEAVASDIHEKRVVQLVPGDPCSLRMDAQRSGPQIAIQTQPVRDCSGNALPDGTAITFTETRDGRTAASVDVPLKHDVAQTKLPAYDGAVLSVATGVVMGNEITVGGRR